MKKYVWLAVLLVIGLAQEAQAQLVPILQPTAIQFSPSPDHSATFPLSGEAIVTEYRALYFTGTAAPLPTQTPAITVPLGKPTPNASNNIVVTNVFGGLISNTLYRAVVVAVGPGGTSAFSNPTDPFGRETRSAPRAATSLTIIP